MGCEVAIASEHSLDITNRKETYVYPGGTNRGNETRDFAEKSLLSSVGEEWETHAGGGLASAATDGRGAQDPPSPRCRATPAGVVWSRGVRGRRGAGLGWPLCARRTRPSPEHSEEPTSCGARTLLSHKDSNRARRPHRRPRPFWLGGGAYMPCSATCTERGAVLPRLFSWLTGRFS